MTDINRQAIFEQVQATLVELFELDAADVTPDAQLYQELDLDSIDAVDLVVHLQNQTGKKIKPEDFKSVRTVDDIVDALIGLMQAD
ncbi:acyl carrier protein [Shewanella sp. GXUN23E]|uniref:acyl carrier protein n=1 Tax=Shewanella sp. GXUN23E TaxID=3422498 RepID=UPI003D7D8CBA